MDDQDVSPLVGVMALGVILAGLAAVAWLLVDASQTTGLARHGQVRMSSARSSARRRRIIDCCTRCAPVSMRRRRAAGQGAWPRLRRPPPRPPRLTVGLGGRLVRQR